MRSRDQECYLEGLEELGSLLIDAIVAFRGFFSHLPDGQTPACARQVARECADLTAFITERGEFEVPLRPAERSAVLAALLAHHASRVAGGARDVGRGVDAPGHVVADVP